MRTTSSTRTPPVGGSDVVAHVVLCGAFLTSVVAVGLQYMTGIFQVALASELGAQPGGPSLSAVSWAASLQSCMFLAGGLPAGWGVNALGARATTFVGAGLIVGGFLLAAQLGTLAGVYLFYSIATGLGCALASVPVVVLVQHYFVTKRGFAAGVVASGGGLGVFFLGPVLQAQVDAGGWVRAFRAAAGIAACALPLAALCLVPIAAKNDGPDQAVLVHHSIAESMPHEPLGLQRDKSSPRGPSVVIGYTERQLLELPPFRQWLAYMACQGSAWFITITHTNASFREAGASAAHAAWLIALGGLATVSGRIVVGFTADALAARVSRLAVLQCCLAFSGLATAALALPSLRGSPHFQTAFILLNCFTGGSTPSLHSPILVELVGIESLPVAMGMAHVFQALAVLASPPAAMALRVALGSWDAVWGAAGALSLVAVFSLSQIATLPHLAPLKLPSVPAAVDFWRRGIARAVSCVRRRRRLGCVAVVVLAAWALFTGRVVSPLLPVVLVCFNPAGYASRWDNTLAQQSRLEATRGVALYTVELAYDDEPYRVTSSSNARHLQLRLPLSSALWHKEALINAAVARLLPRDWRAVAWVDAEVVFENDAWAVETLHELTVPGGADALQPFSHLTQFGGSFSLPSLAALIAAGGHYQRKYFGDTVDTGHYGHALAFRRSTWEVLGGLFTYALVGGADGIILAALYHNKSYVRAFTPPRVHMHEHWYGVLHRYIDKVAAVPLRVGYVEGSIRHVDHGSFEDRQYLNRQQLIAALDPDAHVVMNADGLPVPSVAMPAQIRDAARAYFARRREDSR